jgi:MFS family permease
MFFYNGVFPFVADSSKFIQDKYDFSKKTSSYISGSVYDISMLLSPFLGGIIDIFGKRGYLALSCAVVTIPVFGLLAFSQVHPLVSTLWLGFTYSFAAASMWPSIPLVVSPATIGTAMGLTTSIQMIGIGLSNVIIGQILGEHESLLRWKYVMIFLLANILACCATSFLINVIDRKSNRILNQSRSERLIRRQLEALPQDSDTQVTYEEEPSENDPLITNRSSPRIN